MIVVTSLYHTRRSKQVFERFLSTKNQQDVHLEYYISGAPDAIRYKAWWKDHEMMQLVIIEVLKLTYYTLFKWY